MRGHTTTRRRESDEEDAVPDEERNGSGRGKKGRRDDEFWLRQLWSKYTDARLQAGEQLSTRRILDRGRSERRLRHLG